MGGWVQVRRELRMQGLSVSFCAERACVGSGGRWWVLGSNTLPTFLSTFWSPMARKVMVVTLHSLRCAGSWAGMLFSRPVVPRVRCSCLFWLHPANHPGTPRSLRRRNRGLQGNHFNRSGCVI